ncbi:actin monomer binding [Fusarium beomiforme]|uniref:Actin monomer binding n=1 Tax=Fusarium beomiforme TaxID=44412 RepID=A0A9P5AV75_9HYPO|nr:actin monomer binding [Fusarium beomiforme]
MSTRSTERQTINIPATKDQPFTEPDYLLDDRSTESLKDLQEGDLLQMVVDHEEGIIEFADLNRQVAPENLSKYFEAPGIKKFTFYHHPGSGAVILIWTRLPATASTKNARVQHRLRRDLTWYAEKEGISNVAALEVQSQKDMTVERLKGAIGSSTTNKE